MRKKISHKASASGAAPLAYLQSRFCLVKLGGELRIADSEEISAITTGRRAEGVSFYKKQDGETLLRRHLETLSIPADVKKTIADFWIDKQTHIYDAVAFSPLTTPPTTINYWIGTNVPLKSGDWSPIEAFILDVICNSHRQTYTYLTRYLAHMLQKPEEKPGIMIVMLGAQGTGKGAFFTLLRKIWSRTTLQVSDVDQVVGRFNAALERHYIVCMDEALFSGDKRAIEKLKSLITEPVCRIEQKYQPGRTIDSYHRFFASSNNDHFAHIDQDDRRFLFLRVSSKRQGDAKYFRQLFSKFDDDAVIGAMIHDLQQLDLGSFNVRQRPRTEEHLSQKLQSLSGFERFWFEVLQTGIFNPGGFNAESWSAQSAPQFVATQNLIKHYKESDKNAERYRTVQSQQIAASLKKLCPSAILTRRKLSGDDQQRGYELPSIDVARREFDHAIGGRVNWHQTEPRKPGSFPDWEMEAMWETYHLEEEAG